ncbi:MAG: DUF167 domain-containing protein [Proteobacteria bacterium]|jgi:uncharacterized protein (TIGR00251 family)|nr:DUF167 domain-containing protein [Pseudomonadota bacterium]MDA0927259.1 DUF167 domain-containing protein [Pseudomonadota bacterium]
MIYQRQGSRLYLNCTVQPGARETAIIGVLGDSLKIRLSAAATDGKANKQLLKLLASEFGVKQSAVTLISGASSRKKRLCIEEPVKEPTIPQT